MSDIGSLWNLTVGSSFDQGWSTWVVKEVYTYDWGEDDRSIEYEVSDDEQIRFLSIEEDGDELMMGFYKTLSRSDFEQITTIKLSHPFSPVDSFFFDGRGFFFEEESAGICIAASGEEELLCWDYYDKTEKHMVTIEQWEEEEFDVFLGERIEENDIRNIKL